MMRLQEAECRLALVNLAHLYMRLLPTTSFVEALSIEAGFHVAPSRSFTPEEQRVLRGWIADLAYE